MRYVGWRVGGGQSRKRGERQAGSWRARLEASTSSHGSQPATPPCGSASSARGKAAETYATEVRENRVRLRDAGQGYLSLFKRPFLPSRKHQRLLLAQKLES